jgi:glycosyltransferase involved in cell wall biosynthesis
MTIMFTLLGVGAALELLTHLCARWVHMRTTLAAFGVLLGAFTAGAFAMTQLNIFTLLMSLVLLYRIVNLLRIVKRRMHDHYLKTATRRTSIILLALQGLILGAWWAWEAWGSTGHLAWAVVGLLQAVVGASLYIATVRNLKRTEWPHSDTSYSDAELPSITVAIPARNETEDLQQCLQSLIASDYPKLEIIVLDDCSQVRRTPEIIRDFAQDGVRFIQGHEPSETWLPKNEAYARLAGEASGSYVLFCGVDVRFAPGSLRNMMATMLDRNKQMMSILPRRKHSAYGSFALIQAMRYWWELALPRRQFNRPPVLSTCWMIKQTALAEAGGFKAVARSIVPEAHFARHLIKSDAYSFMRSVDGLGIESGKGMQDQRDTALRMRYPQMHRRPEQVVFTTLWELFFLVAPFALVVAGFFVSIGPVAHISAALAAVLFAAAYFMVTTVTHVNKPLFALIGQPAAALTDIVMLHYSMWKFEFSVVDWKGRNVCVPVMRVVPRLPKG